MTQDQYQTLLDQVHGIRSKIASFGKHHTASTLEIEQLAQDIWSINIKSDDYFNQEQPLPKDQAKILQGQLVALFDSYSVLLDSSWHVSASLFEPFNALVKIKNLLEMLRVRGYWSNKEVLILQEKLNEVENKNVKDGKFGNGEAGQAVLFALLNHCYRLARILLLKNEPVNHFLVPLKEKLEEILRELDELKVKKDKGIHLGRLQLIQEQLRKIDNEKVDGKFVPKDWDPTKDPNAIPEGQALIQSLLEDSFDQAHELLCGNVNEVVEGTLAYNNLKKTLDRLSDDFTEKQAHHLQKSVWDAVAHLKQSGSNVATGIGNLISAGYDKLHGYFTSNLGVSDLVDPALNSFYQELVLIRNGLKKIRNEYAFAEGHTSIQEQLKQEIEKKFSDYRGRLSAVDEKKIDGRFVGDDGSFAPKGQALLTSLLEECHALVYEIQIK